MKKIMLLVFLFLILILLCNKKIDIDLDNTSYDYYKLIIYSDNITTKNFNDFFTINVVGITADVNSIYKITDKKYFFDNRNYIQNLYFFEQLISIRLYNSGYKKQSSLIKLEGVKIKEIYFYSRLDQLKELLDGMPEINYSLIIIRQKIFNEQDKI